MELQSKCKIIRKMALAQNYKPRNAFLLKDSNYLYNINRPSWNRKNYPVYIQKRGFSDESKAQLLRCKVALITGGARGIGCHIADNLLKQGAQAVIIGDVLVDACEETTCRLNEKYGENKALFQPCDVSKKQDLEKIFRCTKERFGKIDIVVNNAGILAEKRWEQTLQINVQGVVHGTILGFQYMSTQNCGNGGCIINTASILGLEPLHACPVYTGTKHFIIGFTRSMAHNYFYKMSKVKCMAVCPGLTETVLVTDIKDGGFPGFPDLAKEFDAWAKQVPLQGPGEVGKCVISMLKEDENGSVWVSEGCSNYKVKIPDRSSYKPKDDPCKKTEDPSKKKDDPSKKTEDPCKKKDDPSKKTEDPCKKKDDPHKKTDDPFKKKDDPSKKTEDPCKKKDDPRKKNDDPCKQQDDPSKKTEDPWKKDDPRKKTDDPCKTQDGQGQKKQDHRKKDGDSSDKSEDPCKKFEDPCKPKGGKSKSKEADDCKNLEKKR